MSILPGFTGLARFYRTGLDSFDFYIRFQSARLERQQKVEVYLPVYAGRDLRQIIRTSTVDHVGSISGPLTEGHANQLYEMARFDKERLFDMELWYYSDFSNNNAKRVTNSFVSSLSFKCVAGEVVSFNMDFLAELAIDYEGSDIEYTLGEKLVTWDKTGIIGAYDTDLISGFTYEINNAPVTIKTGKGIEPRDINPTIQEVRGDITVYNLRRPYIGTDTYELGVRTVNFHIDDWSDEHKVVFDPREDVPLDPGPVIARISWLRVDDFS